MKKQRNIHGFKTPGDYFENLEDRLMPHIKADGLPKETGFTTPQDYFESLEDVLLERVAAEEKTTKVISIFSKRNIIAIAAVAACMLLIVTLSNQTETSSMEDLQLATIADYFSEGSSELDAADLIALLDDETITTLTLETELDSEENIEEYLMETLDDNTLLIE